MFHLKSALRCWAIPTTGSITIIDGSKRTNTGYQKPRSGTLFVRVIDKYGNLYFPSFPSGRGRNRLVLAVSAHFVYQQAMASPRMYPLGFSLNYIDPDWRQSQNISVGLLASHTSNWYRTQVKKARSIAGHKSNVVKSYVVRSNS